MNLMGEIGSGTKKLFLFIGEKFFHNVHLATGVFYNAGNNKLLKNSYVPKNALSH